MAGKGLIAEPVVTKLRQIEVLRAQGKRIAVVCKEAAIQKIMDFIAVWLTSKGWRLSVMKNANINPNSQVTT